MILYSTSCEPCQIEMLFLERISSPRCERCDTVLLEIKPKDVPVEELVVWCIKRIAALEHSAATHGNHQSSVTFQGGEEEPHGSSASEELPFVQSDRDKNTLN